MVLLSSGAPSSSLVSPSEGEPVACSTCVSVACTQLGECASSLAREARARAASSDPCVSGAANGLGCCIDSARLACDGVAAEVAFIALGVCAGMLWLTGARQEWLCGYGLLGLCACALLVARLLRELRTRVSFEASASALAAENESLRLTSAGLSSDVEMLKETIGAIGDKGDDWLGQLRTLHAAQRRENDRHSLLLRGHARIVLLQLLQHFDVDRSMRLSGAELRAAEAFLTAGFPDLDVSSLEATAAAGGVALADLEPLLLAHLEGRDAISQLEVNAPRAQARLLDA